MDRRFGGLRSHENAAARPEAADDGNRRRELAESFQASAAQPTARA